MGMTTLLAHNDLTFSENNWENLNAVVEAYDNLRDRVYTAARANDGALMGSDAWLRFVLDERRMTLSVGTGGISVSGDCYSMQTMSNEHYDFFISFEDLASY